MTTIENIDEDSDISVIVSEIVESEKSLLSSSTAGAKCSSSSLQSRLILLDGTFFKHLPEESIGNKVTALCMRCPKDHETKVKGYNNCTSNFLSHLKRKHGKDCIDDYQKYIKKKKTVEKKVNETIRVTKISKKNIQEKLTQEQFDENIVKYFIHSMIPLRAVEDPYFAAIFSDLQISENGLTLISRRTLGRRIENYYEKQVSQIKSELKEVDHVCTTIDIWSGKKRSFIGVTAHWITSELRRVSVALACQRFKGIHNYERISEIIQEINSDFDLNVNKIVASVTDNGSNFVKAFKIFGVQLGNIDFEDDSSANNISNSHLPEETSESEAEEAETPNAEKVYLLPAHLRCIAHTLSLCATTDANKILSEENTPLSDMHAGLIKKCNALWKAAGRPKSAEIVQDVLQHTLSRPGETRWNSLFDALQQILKLKDKNLLLHKSLNIKHAIKDNEFEYLQEHLACVAPVAEALDIMQSEINTYYGIVLPCLLALRKKLQKIEKKNNFSYCKPLIKSYRQSVEKRFENLFDISTPKAENAAIAALSHPRFKNKWLTCLDPADRTRILNVFKTCISKQINENDTAAPTTKKNSQDFFFNFDSDSDSDMSITETNRLSFSNAPLTKAELLMLHFFAEECQDLKLLNRYPEIKSVFIKYNTPLPSSAAVERLFSFASMTNLPKSHKLSDNMFQKRVVLKCNLNYYKK